MAKLKTIYLGNSYGKETSTFYSMLKASPIAKDDVAVEEVAIWLDINDMSNYSSIMQILNETAKLYHSLDDRVMVDDYDSLLASTAHALNNSIYGTFTNVASPQFQVTFNTTFASEAIFKNMFKLILTTSSLDNIVLSKKFVDEIKRQQEEFKEHTTSTGAFGQMVYNNKCGDLYEIFSELHEGLLAKLFTKKDQSLQA